MKISNNIIRLRFVNVFEHSVFFRIMAICFFSCCWFKPISYQNTQILILWKLYARGILIFIEGENRICWRGWSLCVKRLRKMINQITYSNARYAIVSLYTGYLRVYLKLNSSCICVNPFYVIQNLDVLLKSFEICHISSNIPLSKICLFRKNGQCNWFLMMSINLIVKITNPIN